MKFHYIQQGSPEWHGLRRGRMTASHGQAIGNCGKGLETYIVKMMAQSYSVAEPYRFSNEHTDRGHEREPLARTIYEMQTGFVLEEIGFIERDEFTGCSPDGIMPAQKRGAEFKCESDEKFFHQLYFGEKAIDSAYIWQCQMSMLITGFEVWDHVAYNPNFKQSLIITSIYPDPVKFAALEKGISAGTSLIKAIKAKLHDKLSQPIQFQA